MFDALYGLIDPIFAEATCCVMTGFSFGHRIAGNTFVLGDGSCGTVINECSGSRLFIVLLMIAIIRFRKADKWSWGLLAASPLVAVFFNALRCMIVLGHGLSFHDIGGLAVFMLPIMYYALRSDTMMRRPVVRIGFAFASVMICTWIATPAYANGTKPDPVTPTVKGITLGSPMEVPTQVSLEWQPDEGTQIATNQLVRVYWRDASRTDWQLAAEGYGITNAVVSGFFINRDTDWQVVVSPTNAVEEVQQ